jgi:hypothetical protein
VNWTRATIKVPTHRATPPPPLQISWLLKRVEKKPTRERDEEGDVALASLEAVTSFLTQYTTATSMRWVRAGLACMFWIESAVFSREYR